MSDVGRAVRQSLRQIRRRPAVALLVILTLTLGIGASTAIFTVVSGVLLRPLPYHESGRLVALFTHEIPKGERRNPTSPADFFGWRKGGQSLEDMTAAHPWSPVLTGSGQPEPISGLKATASLFRLLKAKAALGRTFDAREDSGEDVVVLGHRLWQRRFGGDAAIVGRSLTLDGKPHTVLGVMPPDFRFPPFWATNAEMWSPLRLTAQDQSNHSRFLRIFGRLRPGASLTQSRAELEVVARRLTEARPASNAGIAVNVEALHEPVVSQVRPALLMLLGAVVLVLLVACANVTSLLLAQGASREKEMAIRAALGAGRGRLIVQSLAESVSLAVLGGLCGLWLAAVGVDALRLLSPAGFPRLEEIALDRRIVAFDLLLSVLAGIVSGLAPALRRSRSDLTTALKQGDRLAAAGRHRLHDLLVMGEFALALVLLIGAGLMTRSFVKLLEPQPGFRTDGVLTMTVSFSGSPLGEAAKQTPFLDELLSRVRAVPGVDAAALVNHLPVAGDTWGVAFTVEGQTHPPDEPPNAVFRVATRDYLRSLGIPLLRGRDFTDDDRAQAAGVVLVNRALARRYWPDGDPVGRRIRQGGAESQAPWCTIVGVVGDTRQADLVEPVRPEILFPYAQNPVAWYRAATLVVGTHAEPSSLAEPVKAQVWAIDPDLPITHVQSMSQVLSEAVAQERYNAFLLGLFALTALLLAAGGIYGVMAYTVSLRTREIGVRMAIGAGAGSVFKMVVGRGLALSGSGCAAGLLAALGLSRVLSGMVHGVSLTDPTTFAGVAIGLLSVSFAACALPALRAARFDPLTALRRD